VDHAHGTSESAASERHQVGLEPWLKGDGCERNPVGSSWYMGRRPARNIMPMIYSVS
jgi:hypothetical protein